MYQFDRRDLKSMFGDPFVELGSALITSTGLVSKSPLENLALNPIDNFFTVIVTGNFGGCFFH